jgi:hypothetical protein
MQERNIYKDVPISIVRRYVLNKIKGLDDVQLSRVYELVSHNLTLQKTKDNHINILVHEEHDWN